VTGRRRDDIALDQFNAGKRSEPAGHQLKTALSFIPAVASHKHLSSPASYLLRGGIIAVVLRYALSGISMA